MSSIVKYLRKIAVVAIAIPVFILGIILIPLPGPGLLVCLLALVILSFEFDSAKTHRDKILQKLKDMIAASREKAKK